MTPPARRGVCDFCLHRGDVIRAFDQRRWICRSAKDCLARVAQRRRRVKQETRQ